MFNILIFGCGKLGSRHLEGFLIKSFIFNILVIDKSNISLNNGKKKWKKAGGNKLKHKITWSNKLNFKNKNFDLAIIATPSTDRASYIKKLSRDFNIKFWLIEKVLTQSVKEAEVLKGLLKKDTAFVNFSRREMSWHQKLRLEFRGKGPLVVTKIGGLWGLACNSIHFIDLVSWWTDEKLISINTQKLEKKWFASKRFGFYETKGEMTAVFSKGSKLILKSDIKEKKEIIKVNLNNKQTWEIDEKKGKAHLLNKKKILNGRLNNQSELTKIFVKRILKNRKCNLTTLEDSLNNHKIFLSALLSHWNKSNKLKDKSLLVT
jgi:hypothetical protein